MLFALNTLSKSILNGTPRTLQQRDSITDFFRQRIAPPSSQMQYSHRKEHSRLGATSRVLTSLKKGNSSQRNGQNDGIFDLNNISAKLVNVNSMCPKVSWVLLSLVEIRQTLLLNLICIIASGMSGYICWNGTDLIELGTYLSMVTDWSSSNYHPLRHW